MKYRILGRAALVCLFASLSFAAMAVVKVHFNNVVDGRELVFNDSVYKNANGEEFTLSMCKYYISNVSFIKAGGTAVNIEGSYHLVNHAKTSSHNYSISALPAGTHTTMKFLIGVDSLHNVSGAQGGALDPINAMFWDWNTGYINAKIEGLAKAAPNEEISFHIGGFAGKSSTPRWVTITFPQPVKVIAENNITLNLEANIAEWFKTPHTVSFANMPVVTTEGKEAVMIADNYADMFTLKSIEK